MPASLRSPRSACLAFGLAIIFWTSTAAAAGYDFARLVDPNYRLPQRTFPDCCAEPQWWPSVESRQIRSIEDLYAIWQDNNTPDREKAKAFFQAVRDFRGRNDEIVAAAIALYPNVDRKYPDLVPLLEYGVGEYFDYDGSRDFYAGPAGDRSAGLVRHLARQYQRDGLHAEAASLLAGYMARRETETNPHLKQLISLRLAQSLDTLGQTKTADRILANAQTYDGSWEKRISERRGELRARLSLIDRLPENTPDYLLLTVLLLAAATFMMVRRRRA